MTQLKKWHLKTTEMGRIVYATPAGLQPSASIIYLHRKQCAFRFYLHIKLNAQTSS